MASCAGSAAPAARRAPRARRDTTTCARALWWRPRVRRPGFPRRLARTHSHETEYRQPSRAATRPRPRGVWRERTVRARARLRAIAGGRRPVWRAWRRRGPLSTRSGDTGPACPPRLCPQRSRRRSRRCRVRRTVCPAASSSAAWICEEGGRGIQICYRTVRLHNLIGSPVTHDFPQLRSPDHPGAHGRRALHSGAGRRRIGRRRSWLPRRRLQEPRGAASGHREDQRAHLGNGRRQPVPPCRDPGRSRQAHRLRAGHRARGAAASGRGRRAAFR